MDTKPDNAPQPEPLRGAEAQRLCRRAANVTLGCGIAIFGLAVTTGGSGGGPCNPPMPDEIFFPEFGIPAVLFLIIQRWIRRECRLAIIACSLVSLILLAVHMLILYFLVGYSKYIIALRVTPLVAGLSGWTVITLAKAWKAETGAKQN